MTDTESPPQPDTKPAPKTPEPTGPTVRQILYGGLAVCAVAGSVAAFTLAGPFALAGFAGAALVAPAAARRITKGPAKRGPSTIAQLFKARRGSAGKTKATGTLPWSLTGSQSRRAKSKAAGPSLPKLAGKTGKTGLPRLATKQHARPKTRGTVPRMGATPRSTGPRIVPKRPTALKSPTRAPRPTGGAATRKTQPRPGASNRGTLPRLGTTKPGAGKAAGTARPVRRTGQGNRLTPKLPSGGARKTAPRAASGTRRPQPSPPLRSAHPTRRRLSLTPPLTGGTRAAKRIGTKRGGSPTAGRSSKRPAVPNRTRKHPNRKPPQSVPGLIRTGLRVPTRQGLKLTRPTKTKAKTARRSLTRLAARGAGKATRRASSWSWASIRAWFAKLDTRARGLTAPIPLPEGTIVIPAIPPRTEKDIRRKYSNTAKARQPVRIKLTGRRAVTQPTQNGTTITMNPTQSVIEAFTQLAQFEPENATAILELIDALPDMWQEVAAALNAQAQNFSSTQPIQAPVIDLLQSGAAAAAGLSDIAEEARTTFNTVHAEDIARMRGERGLNNEQAWDVSNQ